MLGDNVPYQNTEDAWRKKKESRPERRVGEADDWKKRDKTYQFVMPIQRQELVGVSLDLQWSLATLTQVQKDYVSKVVEFGTEDGKYGASKVNMAYDPKEENVEDLLQCYSSAVSITPTPVPLFVMTTGRFEGKLGSVPVVFMVDLGSEVR
ncbi:hypothetical protein AX16_010922 [Volvariella volvacea WC 439]|nr:hypothetical protein AX16_010922 [Volvariella volvacea WC 439]